MPEQPPEGFHLPRPQDNDAEARVLSSFFIDASKIRAARAAGVSSETWYVPAHRILWEVLTAIDDRGQVLDMLAVISELIDRGKLEAVGGRHGLQRISTAETTVAYFDFNLSRVLEVSQARKDNELLEQAGTAGTRAEYRRVVRILYEQARADDARAVSTAERTQAAVDRKLSEYDDLWRGKRKLTGLATGFPKLDETIRGLQAGNLYIIGGRPAMGKTAFALSMFLNIVRSKRPAVDGAGAVIIDPSTKEVKMVPCRALFISREMPAEQLIDRLISQLTEIPSYRLNSAGMPSSSEAKEVMRVSNILKRYAAEDRLLIDDAARDAEQIGTSIRAAQSSNPLDVVFIDYLQLIRGAGSGSRYSRNDDLDAICDELKTLAKAERVPIVILSQLNRSVESRSGKDKSKAAAAEPTMSDLRDSGAIEQAADVIMFPYRQSVYDTQYDEREASLIIAKNRHGMTPRIPLVWEGELMRYAEAVPELHQP